MTTVKLTELKFSYGGVAVSVRRELVASKVIPVWPAVGNACVLPIYDMVDNDLQDILLDPDGVLLPETECGSAGRQLPTRQVPRHIAKSCHNVHTRRSRSWGRFNPSRPSRVGRIAVELRRSSS